MISSLSIINLVKFQGTSCPTTETIYENSGSASFPFTPILAATVNVTL